MSDDILSELGRQQRRDLEAEPLSMDDELSRPFDADTRASILDAVLARVEGAAAASEAAAPAQAPAQAPAPDDVVPLSARSRWAVLGVVLAIAAALLLWWSRTDPTPRTEPELIAMAPPYAFTQLDGGVATSRSDSGSITDAATPTITLHRGSEVTWVLTPAKPPQGPVGVALLARSDAGQTRLVPRVRAEISDRGGVRLQGPLHELVALDPGTWTLTLLIAAPDQLPATVEAADRAAASLRRLELRAIILPDE